MKSGAVFLLLVVAACAAVSTVQAEDNDDDRSGGFSEEKCVEMIAMARTRFEENRKPMEKFVMEYLCNNIGEKKCKKIKKRLSAILDPKTMDYTMLCRTLKITMKMKKHLQRCDKDKECPFVCSSCKMVVNYVSYAIKVLNMTSEQAKEGMEAYCQVLSPFVDEKICKNVTDHMEEIVQQILEEITPDKICVEMELCNGTATRGEMKKKFEKILSKGGEKISAEFRRSFKLMMKGFEKVSDKMSDRMMKRMSDKWMKKLQKPPMIIRKLQTIFPKLAKVNMHAGKRFRERAQSMRTDFDGFMEKQQGAFKKLTKKWGFGDFSSMMNGGGEEEEQLPVTIDETDEENDVVPSPSIDDNRNVVFKDGKQIDDDEYDVINKRSKRYIHGLLDKIKTHTTKFYEDTTDGDDTDIETFDDIFDPTEFDDGDMIKGIGEKLLPKFFKEGGDEKEDGDGETEDKDNVKDLFGGLFGGIGDVLPKSFEKNISDAIKNAKENLEKLGEEYNKRNKDGKLITDFIPETLLPSSLGLKGIGCTVCKVAVNVIKFEVKTVNASEQAIKKTIEALCKLYPIEAAKDACKKIVDEVDEIIQLIEKDVEVTGICIELGLCPKPSDEKSTTKTFIEPTGVCKRMCGFWRSIHTEDVQKTMDVWSESKEQLVDMCERSQFKAKCYSMMETFKKAEMQLGSVLTREEDEGNEDDSEEDACRCFKKQPVFVTKMFDGCQLCQQMQTGLMRDVMDSKHSMEFLMDQMSRFCEGVPQKDNEKCFRIVKSFNSSFGGLETSLESRDGFCSVVGYCQRNEDKDWMKHLMKNMFSKMGPLLTSVPFNLGGRETNEDKCSFCNACLRNIKTTLSSVTANMTSSTTAKSTAMTSMEEVAPALKDGFAIYCHSQRSGETVQKVCNQLYKGMETIQKTLTSSSSQQQDQEGNDLTSLCRNFDMCQ